MSLKEFKEQYKILYYLAQDLATNKFIFSIALQHIESKAYVAKFNFDMDRDKIIDAVVEDRVFIRPEPKTVEYFLNNSLLLMFDLFARQYQVVDWLPLGESPDMTMVERVNYKIL